MACIMCYIRRPELSMLDYWLDVDFSKFFAGIVPVIPLASGNCLYPVKVLRPDACALQGASCESPADDTRYRRPRRGSLGDIPPSSASPASFAGHSAHSSLSAQSAFKARRDKLEHSE